MKTEHTSKAPGSGGFEQALQTTRSMVGQFLDYANEITEMGYRNAEAQAEQLRGAQRRSTEAAAEQMKVAEAVGQAMTANGESIWREMSSFARNASEQNLATARRLSEAKDPAEWAVIQAEAFSAGLTRFARCAVSLTEIARDGSGSVYEPVSRFVESNVEKVKAVAD